MEKPVKLKASITKTATKSVSTTLQKQRCNLAVTEKMRKKKIKTGALPMLNIPQKSHEKPYSVPRPTLTKNNIPEYLHSLSLSDLITKV